MPSLHHACLPCSWASLQVGDALLEVRPGPRCSSYYLHAGRVTPISLQLSPLPRDPEEDPPPCFSHPLGRPDTAGGGPVPGPRRLVLLGHQANS